MKTCQNICPCGGEYHRHGPAKAKTRATGERYRCKECKTTITVRDGRIVTNVGPRVADWRGAAA